MSDNNHDELLSDMGDLLNKLRSYKPNDRSLKDRAYAVSITMTEQLLAYFLAYCGDIIPKFPDED